MTWQLRATDYAMRDARPGKSHVLRTCESMTFVTVAENSQVTAFAKLRR